MHSLKLLNLVYRIHVVISPTYIIYSCIPTPYCSVSVPLGYQPAFCFYVLPIDPSAVITLFIPWSSNIVPFSLLMHALPNFVQVISAQTHNIILKPYLWLPWRFANFTYSICLSPTLSYKVTEDRNHTFFSVSLVPSTRLCINMSLDNICRLYFPENTKKRQSQLSTSEITDIFVCVLLILFFFLIGSLIYPCSILPFTSFSLLTLSYSFYATTFCSNFMVMDGWWGVYDLFANQSECCTLLT